MTDEYIKVWEKNIYNSLKNISDLEYQKLSWTGKHPIEVSSFTETINTLYDDFEFEEYLNYIANNKVNMYSKLKILDKLIIKYLLEEKDDNEILIDPKWIEISKIASSVIKSWG